MSDFEGRVSEVLHARAEEAPDALGLADAARTRARDRRRTRVVGLGAAAVVAMAIPVGVMALGGDDAPGKTPVAQDSAATDVARAGRWESWHGLTVQVPVAWQYGDQWSWCANGGSADQFLVTRPGGVTETIACTPISSYGISFQEIEMDAEDEPFDWPVVTQTGGGWPSGTYVGAHGENGVLVTVAGPDQRQLLDILATVAPIDRVDPNGCAVHADDPVPQGTLMSVCRYDADGLLVQSERLDTEGTLLAARGIVVAEQATEDGCRGRDSTPDPFVLMSTEEDQVRVVFESESCETRGVFTADGGVRLGPLHRDLLWWAISPGWSGTTEGDVPLPSVLRGYEPAT